LLGKPAFLLLNNSYSQFIVMIEMVLKPETNKYKSYFKYEIIINFKITILIDIELPQISQKSEQIQNDRILFYNLYCFFNFPIILFKLKSTVYKL